MSERWICSECDLECEEGEEVLVEIHRTDGSIEELGGLTVCPHCLSMASTLNRLCDEPGCMIEATSGTPTSDGYKVTCGAHRP